MITERHRTMLRAICARPRSAREFTNAVHDALSPNACASHLNELVRRGFIEINDAGLYEATQAGNDYNNRPEAAPRTYCNATTGKPYTPPKWNIRAGGEAAASVASRGVAC